MNPIIEIMMAFRDGKPVDTTDHLTAAIVTKLVRRGWLGKSVVTGKVSLSDYGAKKLQGISVSQ